MNGSLKGKMLKCSVFLVGKQDIIIQRKILLKALLLKVSLQLYSLPTIFKEIKIHQVKFMTLRMRAF